MITRTCKFQPDEPCRFPFPGPLDKPLVLSATPVPSMDADMLTEAGGAETSKQDRDAIVLADHSLTAVEDQRIADAINALDTLRSSGGSSYASSPTLQTPCSSEAFPFESEADFRDPAIGTADGQQHADSLFGRVSQFPIISGAYTLYERGKNSSGVVKVSGLV